MVGIVVVSHSALVAEGVVALAREMASDVPLLAAGGVEGDGGPDAPRGLGTDAALVMEAVGAAGDAAGGDGVLILMDLGSAVLSAETALDLLGGPDDAVLGGVLLTSAPLVEGAVSAAVASQAGMELSTVAAEATGGLAGKQSHLGQPDQPTTFPGPTDPKPSGADRSGAVEDRFVVTVSQGLHARPAARFVRVASEADAEIEVSNATTGAGPASAASLNAIATLGVREGHELAVRATGPDAADVVRRLREVADPAGVARAGTAGGPAPADAPALAGESVAAGAPASAGESAAAGAPATADGLAVAGGPASPPQPRPGDPAGALRGIPSSPGIAIGVVRQLGLSDEGEAPPIAEQPDGPPDAEWAALDEARTAVRDEVAERRARLAERVGGDEAEILDALALALDDPALLDPARSAIDAGVSAGRAWADAVDAMVARYAALEDDYQRARAADLADVGRRVLARLAARGTAGSAERPTGTDALTGDDGPTDAGRAVDPAATGGARTKDTAGAPTILVARDLTPLDAAGLDPDTVHGIATAEGGPTSHGAILARALGVPAVVGLGQAVLDVNDGTTAILDGGDGMLVVDPDAETRAAYTRKKDTADEAAARARAAAHEDAVTRDQVRIEVAGNIGSSADAAAVVANGGDGVGLMRTEFAFLERDSAPDEDEQVALYRAVANALEGKPLVIRTLDAGADKPLAYLGMPREQNPFLGVRGLRLGLERPELLTTQLKAIVRVATEHENVKLMFPMVTTIGELEAAKKLVERAVEETQAMPRPGFEVGIMVEVPAAALTADHLAEHIDFFSIGTNDLTQYVLAAERGNERLASLADGLHPAVLTLIGEVCRAAAAHDRWVGVCGELAADLKAVPLLVGLGVRELSGAAPSIPAVKQLVRTLDTADAEELAQRAVAQASAEDVRALTTQNTP